MKRPGLFSPGRFFISGKSNIILPLRQWLKRLERLEKLNFYNAYNHYN
jgi:hypothetical protein